MRIYAHIYVNVNSHKSSPGELPMTTLVPAAPGGAAHVLTVEITNNHVYVPLRAAARDLWFLLDTGAGLSLVNQRIADDMNLPLGRRFAVRGAGRGELSGAMLQTPLRVLPAGDAALALQVAAMMPLEQLEAHEGRPIDGLLGFDFLTRHVVRLDYRAQRLTLYDPDSFEYAGVGTTVPLSISNGHPHVAAAVELDEGTWIEGDFVVDIGSALPLTVTSRFGESHRVAEHLQQAFTAEAGRGVGALPRIAVGRLRALRIGALVIPFPVVGLFGHDAGVMSSGEFFDANIGGALLRDYVVILDYSRARLILE
jgi:hypothetical protein